MSRSTATSQHSSRPHASLLSSTAVLHAQHCTLAQSIRAMKGASAVLPELVVSDFAGTAMKEEGAVLVAYRLALTEFDIPFTEDDLAARRGASKRAVFQELAGRVKAPDEVNAIAGKALTAFEDALR